MSGGVSNVVLYIRRPATLGGDFVFKQTREQLRVPQSWFCSIERICREVAVLRRCARIVEQVTAGAHSAMNSAPNPATVTVKVPRILFEDR